MAEFRHFQHVRYHVDLKTEECELGIGVIPGSEKRLVKADQVYFHMRIGDQMALLSLSEEEIRELKVKITKLYK